MALCTQREGAGDGAEKGIQHLKGNADKQKPNSGYEENDEWAKTLFFWHICLLFH